MKKKTKLVIGIFTVLFLIIGLIAGCVFYFLYNIQLTDDFVNGKVCNVGEDTCETTSFIVDEGAWGKSTIVKLYETGILRDETIPYYYYRFVMPRTFIAGYYEIPHNLDLEGLIEYLSDESNVIQDIVYVTFYEDDNIEDFADRLSKPVTNLSSYGLLEYWDDESVVRSYMADYPFLTEEIFEDPDIKHYLEGYLAPNTYQFYSYTSYDEVTRTLLDQTLAIYKEYKADFDKSDLSIHEVFTLASICQWESGDAEDMKKIARAFLNRLDNMLDEGSFLRSSVTACYAFDLDKDECKEVDYNQDKYILVDAPYNTYMREGLPPGPVLCPGKAAIYAALNPADGDYYFFVGDYCYGSGTVFASTYGQHLKNIEKYVNACAS